MTTTPISWQATEASGITTREGKGRTYPFEQGLDDPLFVLENSASQW